MVTCPVCQIAYVSNTLFCTECGLYLLESEVLATDPLEAAQVKWMGGTNDSAGRDRSVLERGPLTVHLRVSQDDQARELEIALTKPIRLGRIDPLQDIYPEVDLTEALALERGVSREHACIFRRGGMVVVEDMGSTNGTLLNGERLAPFLPHHLDDGDQLQLGQLLIEVHFKTYQPQETALQEPSSNRNDA